MSNLRQFLVQAHKRFTRDKLSFNDFVFILPMYLPASKGQHDQRFWYSGDYDLSNSGIYPEDDEAAFTMLKYSIVVCSYIRISVYQSFLKIGANCCTYVDLCASRRSGDVASVQIASTSSS